MADVLYNLGAFGTPNGFDINSKYPEQLKKQIVEHLDLPLIGKLLPNPKVTPDPAIYTLSSFSFNEKIYFGITLFNSIKQIQGNRPGNFYGSFFCCQGSLAGASYRKAFYALEKISAAFLEQEIVVGERYASNLKSLDLNQLNQELFTNYQLNQTTYASSLKSNVQHKLVILLNEQASIEERCITLANLSQALEISNALNIFPLIILTANQEVITEIKNHDKGYLLVHQDTILQGLKREGNSGNFFSYIQSFIEDLTKRSMLSLVSETKSKAEKLIEEKDAFCKAALEKSQELLNEEKAKFEKLQNNFNNQLDRGIKEALRLQNEDFERKLDKERQSLKKSQQALHNAEKSLSEVRDQVANKLRVSNDTIQALQKEKDKGAQELNNCKKINEQLTRSYQEVKNKLDRLESTHQEEIQKLKNSYKNFDDILTKLNQENTGLKKELEHKGIELNEHKRELEKQFRDKKDREVEQIKSYFNERSSELRNSFEAQLRQQEHNHEKQLKAKEANIYTIEQRINHLTTALSELEKKHKALIKEQEESIKQRKRTIEDFQASRQQIVTLNSRIESLQKENHILSVDKQAASKELLQSKKEVESLKSLLHNHKSNSDLENKKLREKITRYKDELRQALGRVPTLTAQPSTTPPSVEEPTLDSAYTYVLALANKSQEAKAFDLTKFNSNPEAKNFFTKVEQTLLSGNYDSRQVQEKLFGRLNFASELPGVLAQVNRTFTFTHGLANADLGYYFNQVPKKNQFLQALALNSYFTFKDFITVDVLTQLEGDSSDQLAMRKQIEQALVASDYGKKILPLLNQLPESNLKRLISSSPGQIFTAISEKSKNVENDSQAFYLYRAHCALSLLNLFINIHKNLQ
ncbi:hypothetical protein CKF54_04120 [Psittacicella hinzii]|uniref:Uncharacterized protein n=1 Tax=Psittacicella hinzii TaxID=2028575 RepID=A0A3A1Y6F6_9GAMM|nr:hypothetical protein [Psittacicella hinzii]RIY32886.1 hypothetical protein CKF54_04120 [Psittacicella hinzii]